MNNELEEKKPFWTKGKRMLLLVLLLLVSCLAFVIAVAFTQFHGVKKLLRSGKAEILRELGREKNKKGFSKNKCNVEEIFLRGDVVTYVSSEKNKGQEDDSDSPGSVETASEDVCKKIEAIDKDDSKMATIIEVDSAGGSPVAAEEMEKCIGRARKPVVAFIRSTGASAAYWSITSADRIYASALSDVGSIGVIISYLDNVESNEYSGLKYHAFSTGKFKDMLSPDRAITKEEEELTMDNLKRNHEIFVETISKNRKLELDAVKEISDGRVFTGGQALEKGLVDELGGLFEVKRYIQANFLGGATAEICSNNK